MTFLLSPKNFLAVFSVITKECNCVNALAALPCKNGSVNMLKNEGSTYLPLAKTDLSPSVNNRDTGPSLVRQVLATPGISALMAGPITPGVDEWVKTYVSYF